MSAKMSSMCSTPIDMRTYQQFLLNVLGRHDNIASLESTFVMEEIKHEYSVSV